MKLRLLLSWTLSTAVLAQAPVAPPPATLGCEEMERFLKTAKIVSQRDLPVGVTVPSRATLDDGRMKHDAAIQSVDISKTSFQTATSTELNFRDSWKFNVAGYEIAKMLELNMVPPYVERDVRGKPSSLSWFVNDAMMGADRHRKKLEPPDALKWNHEIYAVRVFHQLIYDTDPNLTNMLITKDWRIWMIDFSRAFRWIKELPNRKNLAKIDRRLLAKLRELDKDRLQRQVGRWLNKEEIAAVIARRDLLVKHFEDEIAKKGEAVVLYDLPRAAERCGTGLQ